jgi:hypothetical protein
MKKLKSFIITLLVFIAVTALSIFLIETGLLELFLIGLTLALIFIITWHLIHDKFFNK